MGWETQAVLPGKWEQRTLWDPDPNKPRAKPRFCACLANAQLDESGKATNVDCPHGPHN